MELFDKILEILDKVWTLATPLVISHPWQGGVIMRFGRYHRSIGPGYHAKWPVIEDYQLTEIALTTIRLPPQSLTTKDDVGVVVSSIVRYRIADVQRFICDVWDQKDVLADTTMGAIGKSVREHTYDELMHGNPERVILEEVRKGVNEYGFKIYAVTFTDRSKARSLRLVMPNTKDLDN